MSIVVWLASAAVASSFPVAWWALAGGHRKVSHRVNLNLTLNDLTMREAVLERSLSERLVGPLTRGVGRRTMRYTPAGWLAGRTDSLARAGLTGRVTAEQVLGAKVVLPLVIGGLLLLRLLGQWSVSGFLLAGAFTGFAFFMPDLLLRARADRRADEITRQLPDVLDQLTVLVEAGLGFEAGLARIVQSGGGALAQELGRMLQDIQVGTRRVDALEAMARRSQVDDLSSVITALRQAETLGAPLAGTLRTLSLDMRDRRRMRAEERAHQLPVKMIFPLGLCVLPALGIVILGPAVIRYMQMF